MTDIVNGKVIGEVESQFRIRGTFTMHYDNRVIRQMKTEIHVWRPSTMVGREIADSVLAHEWAPETTETGVLCAYSIDTIDEKVG